MAAAPIMSWMGSGLPPVALVHENIQPVPQRLSREPPKNEQADCRCARVPPHQLPVRLAAFVQKRGRAAGAPECRRSSLVAHELGGCRRLSQKAPQFTPTMALMWVRPPPLNSGGSNFEVGSRNLNSFESLNSGAFNSGASELGRFLYAIHWYTGRQCDWFQSTTRK